MTAVDPRGFAGKPANAYVTTQLDLDRVIAAVHVVTLVSIFRIYGDQFIPIR
jgi:hypothetical protein